MPYLILAIGLLLGLYALYRFFLKANVAQIKAAFLVGIMVVLTIALFFMAITGRLAAALGMLVAIAPLAVGYLKAKKAQSTQQDNTAQTGPMDRKEALKILGLPENPSEEEIRSAYKKLMKKVHPDTEGSEWMASKLNEAKDLLLKR